MAYPGHDRYIPNKGTPGNSGWVEGDYVTASDMNHIENGIDGAIELAETYADAAIAGIVTKQGSGDPTTSTAGAVGQHYLNTTTGDIFICTNTTGTYTWVKQYHWDSGKSKYVLVDGSSNVIYAPIRAASVPTSATPGVVGQEYINTTNNDTYLCVGISGSAYTWIPRIKEGKYVDADGNEINIASLQEQLDNKANIDGYYSTLGAGYADNLSSPDGILDTPENDPEYNPFVLRTTAGSQSVSDGLVNVEVYGQSVKVSNESLDSVIENVRKNFGSQAYPTGTQLQFKYNNYDCPMNIVDHHDATAYDGVSESTIKALWMEWNYSIPSDIPFDPAEAMGTITSVGLPIGTYYFKVAGDSWGGKNGKIYQFTTTAALTNGMQIRPSGSYDSASIASVNVYASGKATTALYTFTCTETTSPTGTNLGSMWGTDMDASIESSFKSDDGTHYLNHYHRIYLGYNEWRYSYIRQYLNASGTGWWQSQNCWDRAPANVDSVTGFFGTLPAALRSAIRTIKVYNMANSVTGNGAEYYTYDKIFLHTKKQMAWVQDGSETHNYEWEYYRELADQILGGTTNLFQNYVTYPGLIRYSIQNHSQARYMWTSSANRSHGRYVWLVYSSGYTDNNSAYNSRGCAPAYVLG